MVFLCTGSSSALQHPSSYQKTSCIGSQLSAHMSQDGDVDDMWLYQLHAKQMTYADHLWRLLDNLNYPENSPYLHVSITSLNCGWNDEIMHFEKEACTLIIWLTFVNQPCWSIFQCHNDSRMWQSIAQTAAWWSQRSIHPSNTDDTLVVQTGISILSINFTWKEVQ